MAKTLKVKFQNKCIGCELCVFEAQRQLAKIGLDGSLIRILRNPQGNSFFIELDPKISKLAIEKICAICPTQVFDLVEEDSHEFNE